MRRNIRVLRWPRGFTMTEVLVALLLTSFVLAAAFSFVAAQRPIFAQQSEIQTAQQNLWLAMELVQRDIRKAGLGFGFCQKKVGAIVYKAQVDLWPASAGALQSLRAVNMTDGGASGSDSLTLAYGRPISSGAPDATLSSALALWGATSLQLESAHDGRAFMQPANCVCSGGLMCAFYSSPNTYAVVFQPTDTNPICSLIQITGVATCATNFDISGRPNVTWSTFASQAAGITTYAVGSQVADLGDLVQVSYSIDTTTDPRNPRMIRRTNGGTPEIVGYGIEDFQIVAACDVNNDGIIGPEGSDATAKLSDEWFNNVTGDTISASCTTYPQLRLTLAGRSTVADPSFVAGARPAIDNRSAGLADGFHHRVLSAVTAAPNVAL